MFFPCENKRLSKYDFLHKVIPVAVPWVWSALGPVKPVTVSPAFHVQSKESFLSCVKPHSVISSKSHRLPKNHKWGKKWQEKNFIVM